MKSVCIAVLSVVIAGACTVTKAASRAGFMDAHLQRASFDIGCPEKDLTVVELSENAIGNEATVGVTGCGKKATYVYANKVGWVLNGGVQEAGSSASPSSQPAAQ